MEDEIKEAGLEEAAEEDTEEEFKEVQGE